MTEQTEIIAELRRIAELAKLAILEGYAASHLHVKYKGPADPVTAGDMRANEIIVDHLTRVFGYPVVAEESDPQTYETFRQADRVFFVDPIDGTREYVAKSGEFATLIGLTERGRPIVGLVLVPTTGDTFVGGSKTPAYVCRGGVESAIYVSKTERLEDAHYVTSRVSLPALERCRKLLSPARVTPCGSAGLKAIRVAVGEVDLYAQTTHTGCLWDACGPEAIVRAAGGVYSDAYGLPMDYRAQSVTNMRGVAVGNAALHRRAVDVLSKEF